MRAIKKLIKVESDKRIAVKVIDHRGNEVMVVREMGKG